MRFRLLLTILLATAGESFSQGEADAISRLPNYTPIEKLEGVILVRGSHGSHDFVNVFALWADGFKNHYPNVRIQLEGGGR